MNNEISRKLDKVFEKHRKQDTASRLYGAAECDSCKKKFSSDDIFNSPLSYVKVNHSNESSTQYCRTCLIKELENKGIPYRITKRGDIAILNENNLLSFACKKRTYTPIDLINLKVNTYIDDKNGNLKQNVNSMIDMANRARFAFVSDVHKILSEFQQNGTLDEMIKERKSKKSS